MSQILACCGLLCNECPTYIATINHDEELRKRTAAEWGKMFHTVIAPEQINCRGCQSEERFIHNDSCNIRRCNIERQQSNCGTCDTFPCGEVKNIIDHDQKARERLEALRK